MNVNTEQLKAYIETFHRVLESTVADLLPEFYRRQLLHVALLPARITGYVSTQLGVAIEYEPAAETSIQVIEGSARVEDLIVRAPAAIRATGPVVLIDNENLIWEGGTFLDSFPFRLDGPNATVAFRDVAFQVGSWRRTIHFAEITSIRSAEHWSVARAESRAKDELLAAIVQVKRAKERNIAVSEYIKKFKDQTVLLLGDYDESGLKRLASISAALSSLGYEPLLVRDVPDNPYHDLVQKFVAIAAIARFIVVDDSSKSGHLIEIELCKHNSWVTVLLRAGGRGGSYMTAGAAHASNVIQELAYDPASPAGTVAKAVHWAEAKLKEIMRKFDDTYPWRAGR